MMAERRVVVLREVEGWKRKPKSRAAFLKYLERPAPETVVILVQSAAEEAEDKDLVRGAFAVACEPLPADRARRWLLRRAGTLGVALEDAAADHLLAATGGELGADRRGASEAGGLLPAERRSPPSRSARWWGSATARPSTTGATPRSTATPGERRE